MFGLLGGMADALTRDALNNTANRKDWPDIARPILILTRKTTKSDYLADLTIEFLERLHYWNNRKSTNKVKLMGTIIGFSAVSINVYDNRGGLLGIAFSAAILPANAEMAKDFIFSLSDCKRKRLKREFFEYGGSPLIVNTMLNSVSIDKKFNYKVSVMGELFMRAFSEQRAWLNPSVVLISDGAVPVEVQRGLDQWKKESNFMFRLFSLSADNTHVNKNSFSEDGIDELAKAVVQYVEPKPVPRIPKKSIGDALAVQLPVLEGAMYDNE